MGDFQDRWDALGVRVAEACRRVHRSPEAVSIVVVSKKVEPERVQEAADCGVKVFGENRVQEAMAKIPLCPGHLEWHMVGHLQRNKVVESVRTFRMIHSVDSWRLLEAMHAACEETGSELPLCLEVNVSGESSKYGFSPAEVPAVLDRASRLTRLDIVGLMTMPPFTPDPEGARPVFRRLRELRDAWREQTGVPLEHLSMGMTHDFEVAIEEGATMIRIGTFLFGSRAQ